MLIKSNRLWLDSDLQRPARQGTGSNALTYVNRVPLPHKYNNNMSNVFSLKVFHDNCSMSTTSAVFNPKHRLQRIFCKSIKQ